VGDSKSHRTSVLMQLPWRAARIELHPFPRRVRIRNAI
jgi:hypothetical protein